MSLINLAALVYSRINQGIGLQLEFEGFGPRWGCSAECEGNLCSNFTIQEAFIHAFNKKQQSGQTGDLDCAELYKTSVVCWISPHGGTIGQIKETHTQLFVHPHLGLLPSFNLTSAIFLKSHSLLQTIYTELLHLIPCSYFYFFYYYYCERPKEDGERCQLLSIAHPSWTSHLNACFPWLPLPVMGWHLHSTGLFCPTADLHRSVGKTESGCWKESQLLLPLFPSEH